MSIRNAGFYVTCNDESDGPCNAMSQTAVTESRARELAKEAGWDTGPRRRETRTGTFTHHTDYCPKHRRTP